MRVAPRVVQISQSDSPSKFTAAYRLLRKNGFERVIRAESLSGRYFKIFFAYNGKKNARLGMVVGKRALPGAVDRNRMKREIRELFRQHSIRQRRLDLVVMVKRAYIQEDDALANDLKMLFNSVESRCAEL